jgi:hypothetical protein
MQSQVQWCTPGISALRRQNRRINSGQPGLHSESILKMKKEGKEKCRNWRIQGLEGIRRNNVLETVFGKELGGNWCEMVQSSDIK